MMAEFGGGDVDLEVLTELQGRRPLLAEAMAGYVNWVAKQDHGAFALQQLELRSRAIKELKNAHGRTAENVAVFQLGVETALRFAVEVGAISQGEADERVAAAWVTLVALAREQAQLLHSQNPAERFISLIGSTLSSGRGHVTNVGGGEPDNLAAMGWRVVGHNSEGAEIWRGQGRCIGWVKGEIIALDPEAAYAEAQALASAQHGALAVSKDTLWKRLAEAGKLAAKDEGRNTVKLRTAAGRKNVLCLRLAEIVDLGPDQGELDIPTGKAPQRDEPGGNAPF